MFGAFRPTNVMSGGLLWYGLICFLVWFGGGRCANGGAV